MVVMNGIDPLSIAYRAIALPLSYMTMVGGENFEIPT